jgi:hypothetical protein
MLIRESIQDLQQQAIQDPPTPPDDEESLYRYQQWINLITDELNYRKLKNLENNHLYIQLQLQTIQAIHNGKTQSLIQQIHDLHYEVKKVKQRLYKTKRNYRKLLQEKNHTIQTTTKLLNHQSKLLSHYIQQPLF